MTKADIVYKIAKGTGVERRDTEKVVEGFLESVTDALKKGEHIEIRGFGTFKVVTRAPRIGRNPKSGDVVEIPERRAPVFKPSKDLRKRVASTQLG